MERAQLLANVLEERSAIDCSRTCNRGKVFSSRVLHELSSIGVSDERLFSCFESRLRQ